MSGGKHLPESSILPPRPEPPRAHLCYDYPADHAGDTRPTIAAPDVPGDWLSEQVDLMLAADDWDEAEWWCEACKARITIVHDGGVHEAGHARDCRHRWERRFRAPLGGEGSD